MDCGMTGEQLASLLSVAESTRSADGWDELSRHTLTLHAAYNGAALSFGRIEGIKHEGGLLQARNARGETHVVRLDDVFAGTVEPSREKGRKAGFV
jgi:hypothetical protein